MESLIISPKEKLSVIMNVLSLVNMFRSVSIEYPKRDSFAWQGLLVSFPQLLCILYSIHFYRLWSFLYPARKFAGDVSDFFLKNFPKDDWSEKPNCSAISFTVRSVKTSRRLASL